MNDNGLKFLHIGEGTERRAIAVRAQEGAAPGLLWLGGYKSDMKGAKAAGACRLGGPRRPRLHTIRLFRPR